MRKRISIKTRRPGLSPEAFREHYEGRHVPLGLRYVDRFQWRRYVRNYVVAVAGASVGFDAYTEFWVDDDADDEALARFVASPDFAELDEDDRRFLDVTARFSGEVVRLPFEADLAGATGESPGLDAERADAAETAEKVALLWTSGAAPATEASACAARITRSLGDRLVDATLERVLDPPQTAPFDTLLTMRLVDAGAARMPREAMPGGPWSWLTLDPVETPADRLFGGAQLSGATPSEQTPARRPESERKPQ